MNGARKSQEGKQLVLFAGVKNISVLLCVLACKCCTEIYEIYHDSDLFYYLYIYINKLVLFIHNIHHARANFSSRILRVLMSLTCWLVQTTCHCCHEQPHIQRRVTEGQRSSSLCNSRECKEGPKAAAGLIVCCRQ